MTWLKLHTACRLAGAGHGLYHVLLSYCFGGDASFHCSQNPAAQWQVLVPSLLLPLSPAEAQHSLPEQWCS